MTSITFFYTSYYFFILHFLLFIDYIFANYSFYKIDFLFLLPHPKVQITNNWEKVIFYSQHLFGLSLSFRNILLFLPPKPSEFNRILKLCKNVWFFQLSLNFTLNNCWLLELKLFGSFWWNLHKFQSLCKYMMPCEFGVKLYYKTS